MNRLIIIGNGFDLAHGIKTSYKDFITEYLSTVLDVFFKEDSYSDSLLEITHNIANGYFTKTPLTIQKEDVINYIQRLEKNSNFNFKINSILLKNSLTKISKMNWVDLETEYFNVLLATKDGYKGPGQFKEIQKVNDQLDFLKSKLEEYLGQQQRYFSNISDKKPLIECFTEAIYPHEIVTVALDKKQLPENLYFLNFNYTNTFENYMIECEKIIPTDFNYIHGNLFGGHGKPIFGFGDELDKRYLEFEDEKNNQLFKHIKSFEYLKTKNYSLLTRFIESEHFQVHIYGHSCGLSDRTMLNQIFEHENCKSIKIFYHKIDENHNDYTEKTYEMSRHFKDKGMLRKKVIPFDRSREMPQPSNTI
jgi:hypothetical protein